MKKGKIKLSSTFNLDYTFSSGQIFRWSKYGEIWCGVAYGSLIVLKKRENFLEYKIQGLLTEEDLKSFLGLDQNYEMILDIMKKEPFVSSLSSQYAGLRILKQHKRECFLSYLSACFNNIKRINGMLENLSYLSKRKLEIGNLRYYDYPYFKEIRKIGEQGLRKLGFGFRARYVSEIVKTFDSDEDLEELNELNSEKLENYLLSFKGIGLKTANCVMLYSYSRFESFPIDVWMERALKNFYAHILSNLLEDINKNYNKIKFLLNKLFKNYAGYAQIFLYIYSRNNLKKLQ